MRLIHFLRIFLPTSKSSCQILKIVSFVNVWGWHLWLCNLSHPHIFVPTHPASLFCLPSDPPPPPPHLCPYTSFFTAVPPPPPPHHTPLHTFAPYTYCFILQSLTPPPIFAPLHPASLFLSWHPPASFHHHGCGGLVARHLPGEQMWTFPDLLPWTIFSSGTWV